MVFAQDQLNVLFTRFSGSLAVRPDHHAVFYHVVAGGEQPLVSFHLHDTDSAGTDFIEIS